MTAVHLRDRRQITLPVELVAAAQLQVNDVLQASYVNGVIQLVPMNTQAKRSDLRRFVGAAAASYGSNEAAMNKYVREQRDAW